MIENLTSASPREIDEHLAELQVAYYKAADRVERAEGDVRSISGQKRAYRGRQRVYVGTFDEAVAAVEKIAEGETYKARDAKRILANLDAARAAVTDAQQAMVPFDAEFARRGGWSRFFLVTSSDGHIHSNMNCSTTRITTRFAWLPSVSGKTEAEAVEEHGPLLCTVCFPSAPVAWTIGREKPVCPGSNKHLPQEQITRRGQRAWANCPECGEVQSYSMSGVRKHKPAAA